jgi:hypothetical protein
VTINIPAPVANYLAADKANDLDKFAQCFTWDALVHDERRDYRGIEAIKSWKQHTAAKYNYSVEPLKVSVDGDKVTLSARLTGTFPGSPAQLEYDFTLSNGRIAALDIH